MVKKYYEGKVEVNRRPSESIKSVRILNINTGKTVCIYAGYNPDFAEYEGRMVGFEGELERHGTVIPDMRSLKELKS